VVIGPAAMHGAAVVPHDQIADAPAVPIDEARLSGEGDELLDQPAPFLDRPADDVRSVRGEIERLAAGAGMAAHDQLRHRRQLAADLLVELGEADERARAEDAVLGDEAVELALP